MINIRSSQLLALLVTPACGQSSDQTGDSCKTWFYLRGTADAVSVRHLAAIQRSDTPGHLHTVHQNQDLQLWLLWISIQHWTALHKKGLFKEKNSTVMTKHEPLQLSKSPQYHKSELEVYLEFLTVDT